MPVKSLTDSLQQKLILIGDGAMATSLYDKGFYINRSFEELSLTHPEAVREVTENFKKAGAQLLSTNTFSATRPKLTKYGLQDKLANIITAATQITKSVAGNQAYTMGLIGPLGVVLEPLGPTSLDEASQWFGEMVQAFESVGVDGYSLEHFHDLQELEIAIKAVKGLSKQPIFAHISVQESLKTSYGHSVEEFAQRIEPLGVAVLGISGEVGPSGLFSALEKLRPLTRLPISLKPNAGMPQFVNDQYIYLCNPDYLAKYSKRFIQAGATIVGGGSGVSDSHIRAMSNTVRMLSPQVESETVRVSVGTAEEYRSRGRTPIAKSQRSRLASQLLANERVFTVEINPPKGVDCEGFFKHCKDLVTAGVKYVNIPDGARAVARMSSLQLASYVKHHFDLEPIPHFTCRDRNLIGLQSDLLGAYVNNVRNVLLVTGDPPKLGNCPDATAVYDVDAIGLTHIVSRMNRGLDLGGSEFGAPTEFMAGVALNPTAHNLELELKRFRYKVEAGADFAITQPIYDLEAYQRFMDKFGASRIPIIMGIWPLVSLRNAEFLKNEVPGVQVPDWVIQEMEKAGDDKEESLKRGMDIAIKTMSKAKDLVAGFQVSAPFNRVSVAVEVINAI